MSVELDLNCAARFTKMSSLAQSPNHTNNRHVVQACTDLNEGAESGLIQIPINPISVDKSEGLHMIS